MLGDCVQVECRRSVKCGTLMEPYFLPYCPLYTLVCPSHSLLAPKGSTTVRKYFQHLGRIYREQPSTEMLNASDIMKYLQCTTNILLYLKNSERLWGSCYWTL